MKAVNGSILRVLLVQNSSDDYDGGGLRWIS